MRLQRMVRTMAMTLTDGRGELYQWDTGRTLTVDDSTVTQVHFQNRAYGRTIDVDVKDGSAIIPDELLQKAGDLRVYAFSGTAESGFTKVERVFNVVRRNKPNDYMYTPTEQKSLEGLQKQIGDLSELKTDAKTDIVAAINETATAGQTLGLTGATVGQVPAVKAVDENGVPTEWEAVTNSTPFIVEFSGDGSTAYTSSHTFEQIIDAISAGRYVVGHAEELMVSGDPAYARYNIYFDLVDTMDLATFKFVDTGNSYQINVAIPNVENASVNVFGSYLSASSSTYGGVKADSAEGTDTQPVRIGTDGKLYTAQVQPDWDQNNSSQPDYIKNRTHKREEVLVPSFTLSGTAEATNEGATVKEFTVNSKIGEAPTGMSVYCRINGQPPVLLPKIYIPDYIIFEYSTYGYGDPSVFSSSAYVEGAPSVHDNGLDIGVGDDHYKWIIKVSRDSQYFDYEELTLEFGTSFETVYTPLDENYIPMTVPRVAAASAGDILRVKAVDDHGKPAEWEAVDAASGEDWEFINEISTNEWISSVTINQDSNGNPFSLKKMRIFMTLPKTTNEAGEEQSNPGYAHYKVNDRNPAWQSPAGYWESGLFLWTIEAFGDYYIVSCWKDGANSSTLHHIDVFHDAGYFESITSFTWKLFNANYGWGSTNFKVYGVKA